MFPLWIQAAGWMALFFPEMGENGGGGEYVGGSVDSKVLPFLGTQC